MDLFFYDIATLKQYKVIKYKKAKAYNKVYKVGEAIFVCHSLMILGFSLSDRLSQPWKYLLYWPKWGKLFKRKSQNCGRGFGNTCI